MKKTWVKKLWQKMDRNSTADFHAILAQAEAIMNMDLSEELSYEEQVAAVQQRVDDTLEEWSQSENGNYQRAAEYFSYWARKVGACCDSCTSFAALCAMLDLLPCILLYVASHVHTGAPGRCTTSAQRTVSKTQQHSCREVGAGAAPWHQHTRCAHHRRQRGLPQVPEGTAASALSAAAPEAP